MTKINWDELERLGGGSPIDDEDSQEMVQDAATDGLSCELSADQPSPAPLPVANRRDADLALQPGEALADRHGHLVLKAMARMDEILDLPIDPEYPRALSTVSSTAQHIMTAQIRIDETRLKVRSDDRLSDILARIQQARQELGLTAKTGVVIDMQAMEAPSVDVPTIAPESGANDPEPMEITPSASVPARLNARHDTTPRSHAPVGRHDMPHMRSKR